MVLSAVMALFSCGLVNAQDVVYKMVTDSGVEVSVADVDYLIAADDDDRFYIVKADGEIISDVLEVTVATGAVGIETTKAAAAPVLLASDRLQLSGLRRGETVSLFDAEGRQVYAAVAGSDSLTVSLSDLSQGVYVAKTSRSSVKFMKK